MDKPALQFIEKAVGSRDFEVIALAGDASSRRYYRVVQGEQASVLMVWEPFDDNGKYPFLNVLSHFEKHGVLVPKVVAKAPALGLVLLEDLGDLTLERKFWENQNQALAMPFYKQAIDELLKIHYPASQDMSSDCVAFKVAFNTEKLLWEMNYGRDHLLEKFCGIDFNTSLRTEIDNIFVDICSALDSEEKIICHRDYHSRNVMIKFGKTRVIDFQDARMGAIQYDLVSLVHDSYVDLSEASRTEILDYYLAGAKAYRPNPISRDHFYSVFRLQMLQRCFKACGSFASFYNMREDRRYLKYLAPTVKKVAAVLEQFPQYSAFANLMRDNGLLEMNFEDPMARSPRGGKV